MAAKPQTKPTVREDHDYISINFGQGQVFTLNRSGAKGTNLPSDVFDRLDKYCQEQCRALGNYGKAVAALVENIDSIWADWNRPMPTFVPGDRVICPMDGNVGTVVKKARTNYVVQFDGEQYQTSIGPTLIRKVTP